MMRAIVVAFLMPSIACLAMASPTAAETPDGATVYSQNCGRCHQFRSPIEFDDSRWIVIVSHMRVVGSIPGDQARAVRDYLISQNNPPSPVREKEVVPVEEMSVGDLVARGKELVDGKGCRGCHTIGGVGGVVGPKLDTVYDRRDREFIEEKILNPRESNTESLMPIFGFSSTDAHAIAEYLSTLQE